MRSWESGEHSHAYQIILKKNGYVKETTILYIEIYLNISLCLHELILYHLSIKHSSSIDP